MTLKALTALQKDRDAVSQALDALKQQEAAIFQSHPDWKTSPPSPTQLKRTDAAVSAATTSLANADAVINESITGQNALTNAAAKLVQNVEDIVGAGDQEFLQAMRDLEDLTAPLLSLQSKLDDEVARQRLVTTTVAQRINLAVKLSACQVTPVDCIGDL